MILALRINEDNLVDKSIIFNQSIHVVRDSFNYDFLADNFNKIIGIISMSRGIGVLDCHLTRVEEYSSINSIGKVKQQNTSLLNSLTPRLQRELLILVNDRQAANCLLVDTSIHYPYNSPNWLAEKVIYDLKIDRCS